MNATHIKPGAHSLNPDITVKGCSEAIEFYKKVFGATEHGRIVLPDGKIAHAEIEIEGSLLMMAEENIPMTNKSPATLGGTSVTLALYVADVDAVFKKAIEEGATQVIPVHDEFYGDRVGHVMDPFGYTWMIVTHQKDMSFEEMQRLADKMFAGQ
ncbi:MAG: VOC family protein [Paludibacter sp.]|nr:VOC family protein [Paludibacter sp.]